MQLAVPVDIGSKSLREICTGHKSDIHLEHRMPSQLLRISIQKALFLVLYRRVPNAKHMTAKINAK